MKIDNIRGLIQLANKAGRLSLGMEFTKKMIKENKIEGLIMANDLSENSKRNVLKYRNNNKYFWIYNGFNKNELSELLDRFSLGIVGIIDLNFAKGIKEKLEKLNGGSFE